MSGEEGNEGKIKAGEACSRKFTDDEVFRLPVPDLRSLNGKIRLCYLISPYSTSRVIWRLKSSHIISATSEQFALATIAFFSLFFLSVDEFLQLLRRRSLRSPLLKTNPIISKPAKQHNNVLTWVTLPCDRCIYLRQSLPAPISQFLVLQLILRSLEFLFLKLAFS